MHFKYVYGMVLYVLYTANEGFHCTFLIIPKQTSADSLTKYLTLTVLLLVFTEEKKYLNVTKYKRNHFLRSDNEATILSGDTVNSKTSIIICLNHLFLQDFLRLIIWMTVNLHRRNWSDVLFM